MLVLATKGFRPSDRASSPFESSVGRVRFMTTLAHNLPTGAERHLRCLEARRDALHVLWISYGQALS